MIVLGLWIATLLIVPLAAALDVLDRRRCGRIVRDDPAAARRNGPAPPPPGEPARRPSHPVGPAPRSRPQRGSIRLASGPRTARSGR
jgi:hypothetical protein